MIRSVSVLPWFVCMGFCLLLSWCAIADENSPKLRNDTSRLSRAMARAVERKGKTVTLRTPLTLINIGTVGPRKLRVRSLRSILQTRKLPRESKLIVVTGEATNKKGRVVGTVRLVRDNNDSIVGALALGIKRGDLSAFYTVKTDDTHVTTTIQQESTPNTLESSDRAARAYLRDLKPYSVVRIATDMSCEMYGPRGHNFSSVADANDFVITAISMAEALYARQLNIIFDIVYQHTWTSCQGEPYVAAQGGELVLNADGLLGAMLKEWDNNFVSSVPKFDTAVLFASLLSTQSDRLSNGSKVTFRANPIVGVAIRESCQTPAYAAVSAVYNADNNPDGSSLSENVFSFTETFAHEVGHTLSARHDQSCLPAYLMCATSGDFFNGFSPESVKSISDYVFSLREANPTCFQVKSSDIGSSPTFPRFSPNEIRAISEGETIRIQFNPPTDLDNDIVRLYLSPQVAGAKLEGNIVTYTAPKPLSNSCTNRNVSMTLVAEDSRGNRGTMDLTVYVKVPIPPLVTFDKQLYHGLSGAPIPFKVTSNSSTFPLDENGLGTFSVGGTTSEGRFFLIGPDPAVQVTLNKNSGQGDLIAVPGLYNLLVDVSDCTRASSYESASFFVLPEAGNPGLYFGPASGVIETNLFPMEDKLNDVNRTIEMRRGGLLSQKFLKAGTNSSSRLRVELVGVPPNGLSLTNDGFELRPSEGTFPQSCSAESALSPAIDLPVTFQAIDLDTNLISNRITARIRVYPGSLPPVLKRPSENVVGIPISGSQTSTVNLTNYFMDPDGDPMTFEIINNSDFTVSGNSLRFDAKKHKGRSAVIVAKDCNAKVSQQIEFKVGMSSKPPTSNCKSPLTSSFSATPKGAQITVSSKRIRGDKYSCNTNVSLTTAGVSKTISDFVLRAGKTKRITVKTKKKGKVRVLSTCSLACGTTQTRSSYTVKH